MCLLQIGAANLRSLPSGSSAPCLVGAHLVGWVAVRLPVFACWFLGHDVTGLHISLRGGFRCVTNSASDMTSSSMAHSHSAVSLMLRDDTEIVTQAIEIGQNKSTKNRNVQPARRGWFKYPQSCDVDLICVVCRRTIWVDSRSRWVRNTRSTRPRS